MIIYNITVNLESVIATKWQTWVSTTFIPYMLDTGLFTDALLSRVETPQDIEGETFSIQFTCLNQEDLDKYHQHYFHKTQQHLDTYRNQYVYFDTKLEVLEKQYAAKS